jgi:hypothetical protein
MAFALLGRSTPIAPSVPDHQFQPTQNPFANTPAEMNNGLVEGGEILRRFDYQSAY